MSTTPPPAVPGFITRAVGLELLRALYAELPGVACKGLCHDACTIVAASQLERDVLAEHNITLSNKPAGLVLAQAAANPDGKIGEKCPALTMFGKCSVYGDRPFICRAFGIVSHPAVTGPDRFEQAMMCDHGCEPEATMSVEEFMDVLCRIEALSRTVTGIARSPIPGDSPRLRRMFNADVQTERSGFEVGADINRHASEPVADPGRGMMRSARVFSGGELDGRQLADAVGRRPADTSQRPKVRKGKKKRRKH